MPKITKILGTPKIQTWPVCVTEDVDFALQWVTNNARGQVWYTIVDYANKKAPKMSGIRFKKLSPDLIDREITFWFSRRKDAALAELFLKTKR